MTVNFEPIGIIHSPFKSREDIPRKETSMPIHPLTAKREAFLRHGVLIGRIPSE
jgi:tRNA (Thr-GGU) A37 N-methylase